jgi:hypothetical protein
MKPQGGYTPVTGSMLRTLSAQTNNRFRCEKSNHHFLKGHLLTLGSPQTPYTEIRLIAQ